MRDRHGTHPLGVACPKCGAPAGKKCVARAQFSSHASHKERRQEVQRANGQATQATPPQEDAE